MLKGLKLVHPKHTGQIRSHEHTSYLPLALLLLIAGFLLTTYTAAAWTRPDPQAGSIGILGVMPGKPPTVAATITTPKDGQHFSETPITVGGSCPKDTLIELYKNDVFAGSGVCMTNSTYSFQIDLLIGQNTLTARVYDALNQQGPDSNKVVVYYDALPAQGSPITSLNFGGQQMLLNTDSVFRGAFPNREMSIPLDILGGRAPYALNVQWGDSSNKVVSRADNASFRTSHTYQKAGTYQLSIQATDADGRVAFLTVASIVNGQPDPETIAASNTKTTINGLLLLWPLYTATFAVVVSFWLGEWREKRLLVKHGVITA